MRCLPSFDRKTNSAHCPHRTGGARGYFLKRLILSATPWPFGKAAGDRKRANVNFDRIDFGDLHDRSPPVGVIDRKVAWSGNWLRLTGPSLSDH